MISARIFAIFAFVQIVGIAQPAAADTDLRAERRIEAASMNGDYGWDLWMRAVHRQCPGNHLEWEGLGVEAFDFVNTFIETLPAADRKRLRQKVGPVVNDRCREEEFGFTCELVTYAYGFKEFGLLKRFAKWGCEHEQCDADGLCRYFPNGRRIQRR